MAETSEDTTNPAGTAAASTADSGESHSATAIGHETGMQSGNPGLPDVTNASEPALVSLAQQAVSRCNWVVGECASAWTQRYAKGRTDADFGLLVGLSGDQIYQRRRVWDAFHEEYEKFPELKWSHFYVAINWDDAVDCLHWAAENEATVAEMKAWRRAVRGEDLTEDAPPDAFAGDPAAMLMVPAAVEVRDFTEGDAPFDADESGGRAAARDQESGRAETAYAPYRKDAASVPGEQQPDVGSSSGGNRELSPEQFLRRMTRALQRMTTSLNPQVLEELREAPYEVRAELTDALADFQATVAGLSS